MSSLTLSLLVGLALLSVLPLTASANPEGGEVALLEARRLSGQFLFNEALEQYRVAEQEGADAGEVRFGRAIALLNLQPQRASNINQAIQLLDAIIAEGAGAAGANGDLVVVARYFRARIAHHHQSPVRPAEAAERYAALFRDHPEHRLAQQAMVKMAILRLYDPGDPAPRAALIAEFAALAGHFADAVARRDMHLTLGHAGLFFDLPPELALDHLLAAKSAGVEGHGSRGNLLVAIGELARETGRTEVAAQHYREFLERHRRDNRVYTIRQRLADLEANVGNGEEATVP